MKACKGFKLNTAQTGCIDINECENKLVYQQYCDAFKIIAYLWSFLYDLINRLGVCLYR